MTDSELAQLFPCDLQEQLKSSFQYPSWAAVTSRIRTLPDNPQWVKAEQILSHIMAFADSGLSLGWATAYALFQSFIMAMRLPEGEQTTDNW